jgi:hypothetical protein
MNTAGSSSKRCACFNNLEQSSTLATDDDLGRSVDACSNGEEGWRKTLRDGGEFSRGRMVLPLHVGGGVFGARCAVAVQKGRTASRQSATIGSRGGLCERTLAGTTIQKKIHGSG